jgi:phenylacetate-CoA ligase
LKNQSTKSQYLSKDQLEDLQWVWLDRLLKHAKNNVPFYSRFFKQHTESIDDICKNRSMDSLPVVTRAELMANPDDFKSKIAIPGSYKKATGGSSGEPLHFWVSGESDQWA